MMDESAKFAERFTGQVLVAHPGLLDPQFSKTLVLLTAHNPETGAVGVILNRPLERRLQEMRPELSGTVLGELQVYEGGPVSSEELLFVAWKWEGENRFRIFFGLTLKSMEALLLENPDMEARVFLGYAGWSEGQLENEFSESAWLRMPALEIAFNPPNTENWRKVVRFLEPDLALLADAPDHPEWN